MISIPRIEKPPFGTKLDSTSVFVDSLSLAMPFNAGGGLLAYDSVQEQSHVLENGALYNGGGVEFDASTRHIQGPNGSVLTGKSCITFGYQKTTLPANWCYAVVLEDDYNEFSFFWSPASNVAYVEINSNNLYIPASWVGTLRDGNYHTFSLQWDDTTNYHAIYLDGNLVWSVTDTFTWDTAGVDDHYLAIGGRKTGTNRFVGGILSFFYVHNTNFSSDEMRLLHSNPWQIYEPKQIYFDISTISNIVINQTKQNVLVTIGTHIVVVDKLINQTTQTALATIGSHNVYTDVIVNQTKKSVLATIGSHNVYTDVIVIHTKKSALATPGNHSIAGDVIVNQTTQTALATIGSHNVYTDVIVNQTKKSVLATIGTHNIVVDTVINQTKQNVIVTPGIHTVNTAGDVIINHAKIDVLVTIGNHLIVVDKLINQTKQTVLVTIGTHNVVVDTVINQTKTNVIVTPGTHSVYIDVVINQTKQNVLATIGTHNIVVDAIINQTKQNVLATPGNHSIAGDVIVNQTKQNVLVTIGTHNIVVDTVINQTKTNVIVTPGNHVVNVNVNIIHTKTDVLVTLGTHVVVVDFIYIQTKTSVIVVPGIHTVSTGVVVTFNHTKTDVVAITQSHRIRIFADIYDQYSDLPDNNYFVECTSNYDPDRTLYRSLATEAINQKGVKLTYYVSTYDTTYDQFYGEDVNRFYTRTFDFMGYYELPKEVERWSMFGIEGLDNFKMLVSKDHFSVVSSATGITSAYNPKVSDVIYAQYNDIYYELLDVGEEEEMFLNRKHTWVFTVRPFRDNNVSLSATVSATDLSAYTDQTTDLFDISGAVANEKDEFLYNVSTTEESIDGIWGDW